MDFNGKTAVITGGSSGIGLALAKELVGRGCFVFLAARRAEALEQALAALGEIKPAMGAACITDVGDPAQVAALREDVLRRGRAPDILANCAGVVHPGLFQDLDPEAFEWMMRTNYFGAVNTVRAFLPGMLERRSGVIVNIASLAAVFGVVGYTAYSGSKFALRGFSEALRMEVRPHGVRVALVMPPDTDTPQLAYENRHKPLELKYLLPELGVISPEQVARAIIQGVQRGRFEIVPDFGSKVLVTGYRLAGSLSYTVLDWLLLRARKRIEREQAQQSGSAPGS